MSSFVCADRGGPKMLFLQDVGTKRYAMTELS